MNRVFLAILGGLLITTGLGMAPAQSIHLPLVMQGVYWAVPSDPPTPSSGVQIVKPQKVPQEYADEYQQLLERLEAAMQDRTVIYGSRVHRLRIIQDAGDSKYADNSAFVKQPANNAD